jgi:hypothetical protein
MRRALFLLFVLTAAIASADPFALVPAEATIQSPGTIVININATTTQTIHGLELTIKDTPERATFSHVETTSRTINALVTSAAQGADIVKIAFVLSGSGTGITPGNGSLLKLYYSASGNGEVDFNPSNLKVYNKTGALIAGNSISDTSVKLQTASSGSSSSFGSSGGGGGGSSGKGKSNSGSSGKSSGASTSASTNLPFSFKDTQPAKEELAPTMPPKIIETTANEATPIPAQAQESKKSMWPWIAGFLVFIAGAALIIYAYKKQSKIIS